MNLYAGLTSHEITVTNGAVSHATAIHDTAVTIIAGTAPVSPAISFANANNANTTFTMPDNPVAVTANFEPIPSPTFTVTFNLNSGTYAGNQALLSQYIISGDNAAPLTQNPTRSGFTFAGWNPALNLSDATEESDADISPILDILDKALFIAIRQKAIIGAAHNRLDFTAQSLAISGENLQAAESRIRDADMAREMMRYTMSNVLQQAAVSMLVQANQMPNTVLQLLGD